MTAAAFISRGVLSVSVILAVCLLVLHPHFFAQVKTFARTPFLVSLALLFFIPFVSGLWSDDLSKWSDVVRIKLPLLFLPLAFAGNWNLSSGQWLWLAALFLLCVFGGCVRSLVYYAQHAAQVHEGYLRAKILLTPLADDHVRFSWLVSVAVVLCFWLLKRATAKRERIVLFFGAAFFIAYLHVLSARTGLLSLYLFLILYAGALLLRAQARRTAVFILCAAVVLPLLAYVALPTFKARLRYNLYDLSFVRQAEYLPGSSDGARTLSLKAGWHVLVQNPWGAGAGNLQEEGDKWYAANVPQVLPSDKFYFSSEWLVYGAFAGWIGLVLFSVVMLLPFFTKVRDKIFWCGFHAASVFSFLFDMGLEVQYGVFLYVFIACCWWKWSIVR